MVLNRDMGPVVRLPSLKELHAAAPGALPAPHAPLPVADIEHHVGLLDARLQHSLLCLAAAEGVMSMVMSVSLQRVRDALLKHRPNAPRLWEEHTERWLQVEDPCCGLGGRGTGAGVGGRRVLGLCASGTRGSGLDCGHRGQARAAALQGVCLQWGPPEPPKVHGPRAPGVEVLARGHAVSTSCVRGGDGGTTHPGAGCMAGGPKQHVAARASGQHVCGVARACGGPSVGASGIVV